MAANPMRQKRSFNFYLSSSNYGKAIQETIKKEMPSEITYKEPLLWTVARFDFKGERYSEITLIVQEYGAKVVFKTKDEGSTFELTIPELSDSPPPRKKWLGIF
jgi:hypothetical protein